MTKIAIYKNFGKQLYMPTKYQQIISMGIRVIRTHDFLVKVHSVDITQAESKRGAVILARHTASLN